MRSVGYLLSIVSVVLLGIVAWPKPSDPSWHVLSLVGGMVASIIGMGLRWIDSLRQKRELYQVERETGAR